MLKVETHADIPQVLQHVQDPAAAAILSFLADQVAPQEENQEPQQQGNQEPQA